MKIFKFIVERMVSFLNDMKVEGLSPEQMARLHFTAPKNMLVNIEGEGLSFEFLPASEIEKIELMILQEDRKDNLPKDNFNIFEESLSKSLNNKESLSIKKSFFNNESSSNKKLHDIKDLNDLEEAPELNIDFDNYQITKITAINTESGKSHTAGFIIVNNGKLAITNKISVEVAEEYGFKKYLEVLAAEISMAKNLYFAICKALLHYPERFMVENNYTAPIKGSQLERIFRDELDIEMPIFRAQEYSLKSVIKDIETAEIGNFETGNKSFEAGNGKYKN